MLWVVSVCGLEYPPVNPDTYISHIAGGEYHDFLTESPEAIVEAVKNAVQNVRIVEDEVNCRLTFWEKGSVGILVEKVPTDVEAFFDLLNRFVDFTWTKTEEAIIVAVSPMGLFRLENLGEAISRHLRQEVVVIPQSQVKSVMKGWYWV
ncbi:protein of unknown function (plasmid) [Thermococcus nautili]|uniref:hypothetical protein n=1 Tax=Thermococcus nautili TaxID=195522 RepID=UPI0025531345|nr:hypothetical protein [Thermococcus nautili]CAI1494214.1 protein of unknown function [Thermococcus nautili]